MTPVELIALAASTSLLAGWRLYLVTLVTGLAMKFGWVAMPEQLAALGYVAFAADMYGEGKTVNHPKDAGEMAGKVRANVDAWRKRATAALETLQAQPQCDKTKLAAIGYEYDPLQNQFK